MELVLIKDDLNSYIKEAAGPGTRSTTTATGNPTKALALIRLALSDGPLLQVRNINDLQEL